MKMRGGSMLRGNSTQEETIQPWNVLQEKAKLEATKNVNKYVLRIRKEFENLKKLNQQRGKMKIMKKFINNENYFQSNMLYLTN